MLKFKSPAEIDSLNTKKEGSKDARVLRMDIGMTVVVPHHVMALLLGAGDVDGVEVVEQLFWFPNRERDVRLLNVGEIKAGKETKFRDLHLSLGGLVLDGGYAHKFSMMPAPGMMAVLSFTYSVKNPHPNAVSTVAEILMQEVPAELYPLNRDIDDEDAA